MTDEQNGAAAEHYPDPNRPEWCGACGAAYPCPGSHELPPPVDTRWPTPDGVHPRRQTRAATAREVLHGAKPELARRGYAPAGPHASDAPGGEYLTLTDGRRVRAWRDENGLWQLLVYTPVASAPLVSLYALTSMADPDGTDFPGDPV